MKKRLLIMAAGTGGHIFPGLAIACTMQARGWQVSWLGTEHGMERTLVPGHGIDMDVIDFAGMRGKGWRHTLQGAVKLLMGCVTCFRIMACRKPDVVLGLGGYITVPGGMMARLRGIPLALMNADAALLLSNKMLAPFAQRLLFGFSTDSQQIAAKGVCITGNPVRQEILDLPAPAQRYAQRSGPLRLLVVGGSLGAKALNDCLPAALALIPASLRPIVTHQSGRKHADTLRAAYLKVQVEAEVLEFIDDMPRHYGQADLVICRAGAITVSELMAAGVASVLVPLILSTTSHQRDNAQAMVRQTAAMHLPQTEFTPERVASLLQSLTRAACQKMAEAAYAIGRRDANTAIATVLEDLARSAKTT